MNGGIRRAKLMAQDDLKSLMRIIRERERVKRTNRLGEGHVKDRKSKQ